MASEVALKQFDQNIREIIKEIHYVQGTYDRQSQTSQKSKMWAWLLTTLVQSSANSIVDPKGLWGARSLLHRTLLKKKCQRELAEENVKEDWPVSDYRHTHISDCYLSWKLLSHLLYSWPMEELTENGSQYYPKSRAAMHNVGSHLAHEPKLH